MSTPDPGGCGCPATTAPPQIGGVHHLILNVTDLGRSRNFYQWLMPRVGYDGTRVYDGSVGWFGAYGSFWLKQEDARFAADRFDKDRVGLCEVAFRAENRAQVDAVATGLAGIGARILDPPREYPYRPGYYAVFFADPDGIKLELVHIPE